MINEASYFQRFQDKMISAPNWMPICLLNLAIRCPLVRAPVALDDLGSSIINLDLLGGLGVLAAC
jgi:hypothetical protein